MNETATPATSQGSGADDTRGRLLAAARNAFAERGFAAASVREITAAADANLGAITYHFGSKQGLYDAVLESVFGSLRERVHGAARATAGHPALDRVERIARAIFSVLRENPDFPSLILQQVVATQQLPGPALATFPVVLGTLAAAIREGQGEGALRAGNPLLLAISVVSQPVYFGVLTRFFLPRMPAHLGPRPDWDEVEAHAVAFIRKGLTAGEEA